ncbi:MAG: hypothetical protein OXI77_01800 [Chloroflexota bacterium]|nr:hypothetical protein [Chloroflexota bacterium]MDE2910241.1 hypothetical protein [Chloroflexota bacterium]
MASETMAKAQTDLATRVTAMESARDAERPHMATKAEIIAMEAKLIRWIVGTGIALFAALVAVATPIVLYIVSRLP